MRKIPITVKAVIIYPIALLYYILLGIHKKDLLKQDFHRWCEWQHRPYTLFGFCYLFAQLREFRSIVYNRIGVTRIFISWLWKGQTNLTIACHNIGGGFIVQHGYSTVIVAKSIGKNFHVNQCVNIVWNLDKQCTIGDNVTVCCGAIVVGGVYIGNNVTVGAGAVVVKDVPDNCVVVGNPAYIIKRNVHRVTDLL